MGLRCRDDRTWFCPSTELWCSFTVVSGMLTAVMRFISPQAIRLSGMQNCEQMSLGIVSGSMNCVPLDGEFLLSGNVRRKFPRQGNLLTCFKWPTTGL